MMYPLQKDSIRKTDQHSDLFRLLLFEMLHGGRKS